MATIKWDNVITTRLFINSADAVQSLGNTFTIQLPMPINNVVHLEWLYTDAPGYLLQLDEWGDSITSIGRLYWRFLDTNSNQRYTEWQQSTDTYKDPRTLRTLTFSIFNKSSIGDSPPDGFCIELIVYSVRQ